MSAFFKQVWKYLAIFFAGIIAALVWAMKQVQPVQTNTNIEAGTYVEKQDIGKLKQRGEGNSQQVGPGIESKSRKELRRERRAERKEKRKNKDSKELSPEQLVIMVGVFLSFRGWY